MRGEKLSMKSERKREPNKGGRWKATNENALLTPVLYETKITRQSI